MQKTSFMKHIISVEYLIAAILVAVFYITVARFEWYWLLIVFFVYDLSAAGYLINKEAGAYIYNLVHSIVGPALLTLVYIVVDSSPALLFVILTWLFHIFVDRALGFGLKHRTDFKDTHLGKIGKSKKR